RQRCEFVLQAERCAGRLVPPHRLFLEADVGAVPVLQCHANAAHDEIAAASHPGGAFGIDPDDLVDLLGRVGAVLEAHEVARRPDIGRTRQESGLCPTYLGSTVRQSYQLADRVKRYLRIVRARLDRKVTTGSLWHQLIAVEQRQFDQCRWPQTSEAV